MKTLIDIGNNRNLCVEIDERLKEVTVCVETPDGYQDLALVRPHKEQGYEALIWSDAQDECYTQSFHIPPTRF